MNPAAAVERAVEILAGEGGEPPMALLTLGSGLAALGSSMEVVRTVAFSELPGLPDTGVAGHEGRFVLGSLEGVPLLIQSGRFHGYEGHPSDVVTAPVRVAERLGVEAVVLTNAAGGLRPGLLPGSLMLVEDHLDWQHLGVLRGPARPREARFPDMSAPYDLDLQRIAMDVGLSEGIGLERGRYAAVLGPSYETRAEVRMLRRLGADAVGMSTVPETIVARALGLRVLAVSMITNAHSEMPVGTLSHEDVVDVATAAASRFERLVRGVLRRLRDDPPGSAQPGWPGRAQ